MSLHHHGIAWHHLRRRAALGAAPLLGALLLGASGLTLSACDDGGGMDEFVEEVEDEAEDAKKQIEDEIDDHS